jgi:hypothetical protein
MRLARGIGYAGVAYLAVYLAMVTSVGPLDLSVHVTRPVAGVIALAGSVLGFLVGWQQAPARRARDADRA